MQADVKAGTLSLEMKATGFLLHYCESEAVIQKETLLSYPLLAFASYFRTQWPP